MLRLNITVAFIFCGIFQAYIRLSNFGNTIFIVYSLILSKHVLLHEYPFYSDFQGNSQNSSNIYCEYVHCLKFMAFPNAKMEHSGNIVHFCSSIIFSMNMRNANSTEFEDWYIIGSANNHSFMALLPFKKKILDSSRMA